VVVQCRRNRFVQTAIDAHRCNDPIASRLALRLSWNHCSSGLRWRRQVGLRRFRQTPRAALQRIDKENGLEHDRVNCQRTDRSSVVLAARAVRVRQAALRFYIDKLGFEKKSHKGTVCEVNRGGCEIIPCEDWVRRDKGRLFVELNRDGIDELRREIWERSVPTQHPVGLRRDPDRRSWWQRTPLSP
jgi:hypothetical protein